MDSNRKRFHLLKLWNAFPSSATLDDAKTEATLNEWLEITERFSPDDVAGACAALKRRNIAFLPSAGQIYAECEKAAADNYARRNAETRRLPKPEMSEAQRDGMKARFNALLAELASGANSNLNYGHVPKGTKPAKKLVERTVPPSWQERWARENGRPYYGAKEAAE